MRLAVIVPEHETSDGGLRAALDQALDALRLARHAVRRLTVIPGSQPDTSIALQESLGAFHPHLVFGLDDGRSGLTVRAALSVASRIAPGTTTMLIGAPCRGLTPDKRADWTVECRSEVVAPLLATFCELGPTAITERDGLRILKRPVKDRLGDGVVPEEWPPKWELGSFLPGDEKTFIPTILPPSEAVFRERYQGLSRPVLLRGLCSSWGASKRWTIPALKERLGQKVVPAVRLRNGMWGYDDKNGMETETRRLGEVLDSLDGTEPPKWFLMLEPDTDVPELAAEVEPIDYCRNALWKNTRITIGGREANAPNHREIADNFFLLFTGEKEFLLFSPRDTSELYPNSVFSGAPHLSKADLRITDPSAFPRLSMCRPWRCIVREGDALFVPRLWWHVVTTRAPSVGLGYWWAEGLSSVVPLAARAYRRMRSLST